MPGYAHQAGMSRHTSVLLAVLAVFLAAACGDDNGNGDAPANGDDGTPSGLVPLEAPPDVLRNAEQWPLAGRDYRNHRAAPTAGIDSENVDDLEVAWSFDLPNATPFGAHSGGALILDDVIYFQDLAGSVFALSLDDGDLLWQADYDAQLGGPITPAYGWEKIFAGVGENRLVALDAETGDEEWMITLDGPTSAMHPVVLDRLLFASSPTEGGEPGVSGHAYAINEETGDVRWSFRVVESDDFWGNPDINNGGGVWYPPAIDIDEAVTYWGTGNANPFPGIEGYPNGESRPGDNLYTNSLIALDATTGELLWYDQARPGDILGLDFQGPPMLTDAEIDGDERDIVISGGNLGRVIAYDRGSGERLWDTPIGEHMNDDIEMIPPGETVTVIPGSLSGIETPMSLYDGRVFAAVGNVPTGYTATAGGAADISEAEENNSEATRLEDGDGDVFALEVATGDILWETSFPMPSLGSTTVVGDLVFASTFDGMLHALDMETGEVVWSKQLPALSGSWPSVAGDTMIVIAGIGQNPQVLAFRPSE